MLKIINKKMIVAQSTVMGVLLSGASQAHAQVGDNDFSVIAENIADSVEELPGLLSAFAYMIGLLMGVLGVLKIKDHVENPSQTQLKDGAIRLAAGGALFALPMLFESMQNTIGLTNNLVEPAELEGATFRIRP